MKVVKYTTVIYRNGMEPTRVIMCEQDTPDVQELLDKRFSTHLQSVHDGVPDWNLEGHYDMTHEAASADLQKRWDALNLEPHQHVFDMLQDGGDHGRPQSPSVAAPQNCDKCATMLWELMRENLGHSTDTEEGTVSIKSLFASAIETSIYHAQNHIGR